MTWKLANQTESGKLISGLAEPGRILNIASMGARRGWAIVGGRPPPPPEKSKKFFGVYVHGHFCCFFSMWGHFCYVVLMGGLFKLFFSCGGHLWGLPPPYEISACTHDAII